MGNRIIIIIFVNIFDELMKVRTLGSDGRGRGQLTGEVKAEEAIN